MLGQRRRQWLNNKPSLGLYVSYVIHEKSDNVFIFVLYVLICNDIKRPIQSSILTGDLVENSPTPHPPFSC